MVTLPLKEAIARCDAEFNDFCDGNIVTSSANTVLQYLHSRDASIIKALIAEAEGMKRLAIKTLESSGVVESALTSLIASLQSHIADDPSTS